MKTIEARLAQTLEARQEFRLYPLLQQANLLELPQDEFNRLIKEIEDSPLFRRLCRNDKIIRYQKLPRTGLSSSFYQLKEECVASPGSADVESLLTDKEHIVRLIQEIGLERFKRYFLYPEETMRAEEVAEACHLAVSEVQKINALIDDLTVMSEFYNPSALNGGQGIHYSKIASIEREGEGFVLGYFSPSLARGVYKIDHERFEELRRAGKLSESEAGEAKKLFSKLGQINLCKETLTRILHFLMEKQAPYLENGDERALLTYSQRELAKKTGLAPSTISRAIRGKSLGTPWGEEKPLKDFFPRPRRFKKALLQRLLEAETEPLSDEAIKDRLRKECGVSISRRSVACLRKELKIPSGAMRRRQSIALDKRKGVADGRSTYHPR